MVKTDLLKKIRLDRPTQVIHSIIKSKKNKFGFYDVKVDMEGEMMGTKINHFKVTLPYPYAEYVKLSEQDQEDWRWNNM